MTVQELISILEEMEPDAEVVIVYQQNWPLESSLGGVALRADVESADLDEDEDHDGDTEPTDASERRRRREDAAPTDVILVEGSHLRYGNRDAWEVAHRG
jgi:hypothetical protein